MAQAQRIPWNPPSDKALNVEVRKSEGENAPAANGESVLRLALKSVDEAPELVADTSPRTEDLEAAVGIVRQTAAAVKASGERHRQLEAEIRDLLERANTELDAAEKRVQAAEARALAAEARVKEKDEWLGRLQGIIMEQLASLGVRS